MWWYEGKISDAWELFWIFNMLLLMYMGWKITPLSNVWYMVIYSLKASNLSHGTFLGIFGYVCWWIYLKLEIVDLVCHLGWFSTPLSPQGGFHPKKTSHHETLSVSCILISLFFFFQNCRFGIAFNHFPGLFNCIANSWSYLIFLFLQ